jgi:hypothetical protein
MKLLSCFVASVIFIGFSGFILSDPVNAQSQVMTMSQINEMRVQVGLLPLTGGSQDFDMLQMECSMNIAGSCMLLQGQIQVVPDTPIMPSMPQLGTVSTPNPNRYECVEACAQGCPEPELGSIVSGTICRQNCVNQCF